jgi:hypothetical protein
MSQPIYRTFVARRLAARNVAIVMIAAGLLACVAAIRVRFPASLWVLLGGGGALFLAGLGMLAGAYGPPTREVLVLARERRAALTPVDLVTEMSLEADNARVVLEAMARKGLLRKADNAEAYLLAGDAPRPSGKS